MKKIGLLLVFCLTSFFLLAQDKIEITESDYANQEVEMADRFREEGKIYILTGVICIILGGMVTYLVVIDKKVSRIEKQLLNNDI
ncbi:CcmD family protein [Fulvivirga sp. 29W222]|uniref:CcmD family protein n=1 Tax=Fulvivirga marina TaxID=2494733 RepID=A0A937G121_9BACT|nr:CcmD family protein [Fulvivirga marina]MBL6449845.1 CcmD family protein [Fulvivirga marina]